MTSRLLGGRYELGEVLGQGGMAVVYRALDRTLGRQVAVKILRDQYADDPEFVERFEREARAAARLAHPNVVDIYDVGSDGSTRYMVMQLVEGESLKGLIRRGGPLPPALVIRFGREIADALEFAHRRGLIHRDVKPQNVLVDADGHAKLTDFGIAHAADNVSLTQTGTVLGTAHYMAPEQARGQPTGPASDLYSLGVVLYELATGRLPFEGGGSLTIALRHVQEEPIPPRRVNPSVPPALETVILRAMAKDPAARYASAEELADALTNTPDPVRERTTPMPVADRDHGRGLTESGRGARSGAVVVSARPRTAALPRSRAAARRRYPGAGRSVVLLLLLLGGLGLLALGLNWLSGLTRPSPVVAATPSPQQALVSSPTPVPPTATRPAPTATATPAPTAPPTPTATRVPPTATPAPTAPPTPAVTPTSARVAVPRVVGLNLEAAQAQLGGRGLIMEFVDGNDPRQPNGVILSQTPAEGEAVAPRSVVRVAVNRLSTATLLTVPNVGGMSEDEARRTLEKEGFKVAVEEIRRGNRGIVNDQAPQPGVRVAPGTEVKITVGR